MNPVLPEGSASCLGSELTGSQEFLMPTVPESRRSFQAQLVGLRSAGRRSGNPRYEQWGVLGSLSWENFWNPSPFSLWPLASLCKAGTSPTFQRDCWDQWCEVLWMGMLSPREAK